MNELFGFRRLEIQNIDLFIYYLVLLKKTCVFIRKFIVPLYKTFKRISESGINIYLLTRQSLNASINKNGCSLKINKTVCNTNVEESVEYSCLVCFDTVHTIAVLLKP